MIFEKSVNQIKFIEYLVELRKRHPFDRLAIFMDNLRAHKTNAVMEKLEELQIKCVFNVPYQPDMNPCEGCNQILKQHYKKRKLDMLIKEEEFDPKTLIKESLDRL